MPPSRSCRARACRSGSTAGRSTRAPWTCWCRRASWRMRARSGGTCARPRNSRRSRCASPTCARAVRMRSLVAALFVSILRMLYRIRRANQTWRTYPVFLLAENRWRAQRYGVGGTLFDFGKGELVPFLTCWKNCLRLCTRMRRPSAASTRSRTRAASPATAPAPTVRCACWKLRKRLAPLPKRRCAQWWITSSPKARPSRIPVTSEARQSEPPHFRVNEGRCGKRQGVERAAGWWLLAAIRAFRPAPRRGVGRRVGLRQSVGCSLQLAPSGRLPAGEWEGGKGLGSPLAARCNPRFRPAPRREWEGGKGLRQSAGCSLQSAPSGRLPAGESEGASKKAEPREPVAAVIPRGPYRCRWAPCDRNHGSGQGQLPRESYRPPGQWLPTRTAALLISRCARRRQKSCEAGDLNLCLLPG